MLWQIRKHAAAWLMCMTCAVTLTSLAQRSPPSPTPAEQLLQQALAEYKAASAIGHRDFASSQRKYMHAVYLLEELAAKYPSFLHMDRVLLLAGKCKREVRESGEGGAFIKRHPADYQYFEVAGLEYTGTDFRLLMSKFPQSPLVPDAAYELASSKILPECEGEWDCHLRRALDRFEPFIRQYPSSPRVRDAIRSINAVGLRHCVAWGAAGVCASTYLDELAKDKASGAGDTARRFEIQLARYHSLVTQLDSRSWAEAGPALADAYEILGDTKAARQVYRELLEKLPRASQARTWQKKLERISQSQR